MHYEISEALYMHFLEQLSYPPLYTSMTSEALDALLSNKLTNPLLRSTHTKSLHWKMGMLQQLYPILVEG